VLTAYPPKLILPYRVARPWLEQRTLAGEIVAPVQRLTIDCELLDASARLSAARVTKRIDATAFDARAAPIFVRGSGLSPAMERVEPGGRIRRPTDPVVRRIGGLPVLPEPIDDPLPLLAAYERWIGQYLELSCDALTDWIEQWSTDAPSRGDEIWWRTALAYAHAEKPGIAMIDGRHDPVLFHRAVSAGQLLDGTREAVEQEDWDVAQEIVGFFELDTPSPKEVVSAYVTHAERISDLAFARSWARMRAKDSFDTEMRRWATERGSDRLQIGLSDGYRMVPVYLEERLAQDAPGFYAHLPRRDDPHGWQPRTAPSEAALILRRAVEQRLRFHAPRGMVVPPVEIGWMKTPPLAMCDLAHCYEINEWGRVTDDLREWPFEIICVRGWLGRYTLLAGVYNETGDRPPPFLLLRHVLRPALYGVSSLPSPPAGVSLDRIDPDRSVADDIPL
jgi:hypothetical protein